MSKLHEELRNRADSQWYVRITDGAIYGPVDLKTLQSWAAQGRIEPDNEISEDQEIWSTAESLPELEMDWLVELEDGASYGPFNIQLAPELQKQGAFPLDAPLRHRETGETRTMAATKDEQPTFLFDDEVITQSEAPKRKKAKKPQQPTSPPTPAAEEEMPSPPEPNNTEPDPQTEATEPELSDNEQEPQSPEAESPSPIAEEALDPDAATRDALQDDSKEIALAITTAPEDRQEIVALRLETLQQSASQARAQLSTTRIALTEQRAASAAMQEQIRKVQEDLRNSESEREASERQLLEQQDALAQALSESENLNAQLQQLQDHYDRLQIESQNQFEALDQLRSESMQREQEFKRRLGNEKDRANAKTSILAQTIRLIIQDEDVEHGELPKELLSPADSGQVQELQTRITQLQKQDERERKRIQTLEAQLAAPRNSLAHSIITTILVLLVLGLIGTLIYVLGHRGTDHLSHRKAIISSEDETSIQPLAQTAQAGLIVTNTERIDHHTPMSINTADTSELDLPPEDGNQPVVIPFASPTTWPPLNIPRARITKTETSCQIAFTYGIFSSDTQLTPVATQDLETLANQLRDRHDKFTLLVEGHTDAMPISSQVAKYVDNYALGMARAERVKRFLEDQCRLPKGFIRTASAGEADPPHSNETDASRRKNRTVVLTLTSR